MDSLILIVDDDAPVRELERRVLAAAGYRVHEAAGAAAAFAWLERGHQVALLIADFEMPDLDGTRMVRHMRTQRPGLKVLYVTGRIDRLRELQPTTREGEAFLEKPFTEEGLRQAVALLLGDKAGEP